MPKIIEVRPNGRKRVATVNDLPSRTSQQWKDSCDVNKIMEKYKKTGSITHVRNRVEGVYADLTQLPVSYQEALDTIKTAEKAFEAIPAKVRQEFDNNPSKLISFLADKKNLDKAAELGLVNKPIQTEESSVLTPSSSPSTPQTTK